jgi:GH24 family phage-related lysozyme (muramidase)
LNGSVRGQAAFKRLSDSYAHVVNESSADVARASGYSDALVRFIQGWEGFRTGTYDDGFGNVTKGYGTVTTDTTEVNEADAMLQITMHLASEVKDLRRYLRESLSQHQLDSLLDLGYNMGVGGRKSRGGLIHTAVFEAVNSGADPTLSSYTRLSYVFNKHTNAYQWVYPVFQRRTADWMMYTYGLYYSEHTKTRIFNDVSDWAK